MHFRMGLNPIQVKCVQVKWNVWNSPPSWWTHFRKGLNPVQVKWRVWNSSLSWRMHFRKGLNPFHVNWSAWDSPEGGKGGQGGREDAFSWEINCSFHNSQKIKSAFHVSRKNSAFFQDLRSLWYLKSNTYGTALLNVFIIRKLLVLCEAKRKPSNNWKSPVTVTQ